MAIVGLFRHTFNLYARLLLGKEIPGSMPFAAARAAFAAPYAGAAKAVSKANSSAAVFKVLYGFLFFIRLRILRLNIHHVYLRSCHSAFYIMGSFQQKIVRFITGCGEKDQINSLFRLPAQDYKQRCPEK
jgi:hypothetical protein